MDEITFDGKKYLSSKRAAKLTGYAKDYVGQLCREGRVTARLVGRNWYVLEESIRQHRFGLAENSKKKKHSETRKTTNVSAVLNTKEQIRYIPEEVTPIPVIKKQHKSEEHTQIYIKPHGNNSVADLSDMQGTWEEWFKHKYTKKDVDFIEPEKRQKLEEESSRDTVHNIGISRIPDVSNTCHIEKNKDIDLKPKLSSEIPSEIHRMSEKESFKKQSSISNFNEDVHSRDVSEYLQESALEKMEKTVSNVLITYVVNSLFVIIAFVVLVVLIANIFNLSNSLSYFLIPQSISHYLLGVTTYVR